MAGNHQAPNNSARKAARTILDINDEAKQIVQELGSAINAAVENSPQVAEAIERLREAGYEMELTLRLEIGLRPHDEEGEEGSDDGAFELTDEEPPHAQAHEDSH